MTIVLAASGLVRPGDRPTGRGDGQHGSGPSGFAPGWIAIDGATIVDVGSGDSPAGATDLGDVVLAPGYVDLQCNGIDGDDFARADVDGWERAATTLAAHGVTSYCATFVSASRARYDTAMATAARVLATQATPAGTSDEERTGSQCLGVHLEGPFLGAAVGAHDLDHVSPADLDWVDAILDAWPRTVRIVTLAPEADPTSAAIRRLVAAGVTVALGHSTASYDAARAAVDAGATVATHLFNAMGPLHQREPGLAGVALDDERMTPTLIADLVHVHPALVRLAFARRRQVALVSDSVAIGGPVVARDGAAYLADGTLAGATLLLDGAVAAAVRSGIAPARAIDAATSVPAALVGADDRGRLEPGARADVLALDPVSFAVRRVWSCGRDPRAGAGPRAARQ